MKLQFTKLVIIGFLFVQIACESTVNKVSDGNSAPTNVAEKLTSKAETNNDQETPKTTILNNVIGDFVPEGYTIIGQDSGSLNGDDQEDVVLVLQDESDSEANRIVFLLVKNEAGNYEKVAENRQAILCQDCGGTLGDPFNRVVVKDDYFTIEHFGGSADRWARYSTFKYDASSSKWRWHKDATVLTSAHDLSYEKTEETKTDQRFFGRFEVKQ